MAEWVKAWWWIVRHPFKSAAIRRYLIDHPEKEARRG